MRAAKAGKAAEWKAKGNAAIREGKLAEAARCYEQGMLADTADSALRLNLGFALLEQGEFEGACRRLNEALSLRRPDEDFAHEAHYLLARAHRAAGRPAEALRSCEAALEAAPEFAEPLAQGVDALQALQRHDDAAAWARRLLALQPAPETHLLLVRALDAAGRKAEATEALRAACAAEPASRDLSLACFTALFHARRMKEALAEAQRLLAVRGPDAGVLCNMAAALGSLGRPADALAALDEALRLEPGNREMLVNRAALLFLVGRPQEAANCAEEGLRLFPDDAQLHWNLGLTRLLLGDFERGWPEHEWRDMADSLGAPGRLPQPRWRGEDLAGRSILLYGEQGFGDIIQFLRFVPEIARRAQTVHVRVLRPLEPLLAQLPDNCKVVPQGAALPQTDYQCPLMSLPAVLRTTQATVPAVIPYLHADRARVGAWRERLAGPGLKVGIAWAGKPTHRLDHLRSMPLEMFRGIAAPGCRFFTLQPDLREEDRAALARWPQAQDLGRELRDFGDTAAMMEALDLVIAPDTSVAHLAGALGRPVWVMLQYMPDWRWMLGRDDSPWYPTLRLFRQEAPDDWAPVVARVRRELADLAAGRNGS
nr:tetratricopeptide repeat protein [Ramlibacter agri]